MGFISRRLKRFFPAACVAVTLSGCATFSSTHGPIEQKLADGLPAEALALLEARGAPERDRVLFLLDKAMLQRLSGDYAASNGTFEEAKTLIEKLEAVSVSETTGAFIVNDAARSYVGEPFEQALLHAYEALNYLDLGRLDEARVEALQVDERLRLRASPRADALAQDPFARYLAGLIYDAGGEASDALIAYRNAYESYQAHETLYGLKTPVALKKDLLRLTQTLGLTDEHRELAERFALTDGFAQELSGDQGELVFFLHGGLAPVKRERVSVIYPPLAERIVTVALPDYVERIRGPGGARLTLGASTAQTETVENIGAIAVNTLKQDMGAITTRAVVRAVAKYKVAQQAGKENRVAGLMTNLAGLFMERADTRSWLTLPGEIQMARVRAPMGEYKLHVDVVSETGSVVDGRDFDVKIERGKITFLSYHWISPSAAGRMK